MSHARASGLKRFLADVFLPAGYPSSVSPDYLHYQIYNALQAFCSSLSGLIASRAVLEGFGVGDASATATNAMLLSVFQDIFSRLSTIIGAYYLGTSLVPEAKTYRLLADILNDMAIALDTLSPYYNTLLIPLWFVVIPGPVLRVAALCISGSLRALCGVCAGGSKAALTVHFASTAQGPGDVGELSAKDGSKETVLGLFGLLSGTLLIPHLTTPSATYAALFALLAGHLLFNYLAVRGVAMRALNRQRAHLAWTLFDAAGTAPAPAEVARHERIFAPEGQLRTRGGRRCGSCTFDAPSAYFFGGAVAGDPSRTPSQAVPSFSAGIMEVFRDETYFLWWPPGSGNRTSSRIHLYIAMKRGHTPVDTLKAWVHALHAAEALTARPREPSVEVLGTSLEALNGLWPEFLRSMRDRGWRVDEGLLVGSGTIRTFSLETVLEEKKRI